MLGVLSAFRVLRVLRPLRMLSRLSKLRALMTAVTDSAKDIAAVMTVLSFFFLLFSVVFLQLWSGTLHQGCVRFVGTHSTWSNLTTIRALANGSMTVWDPEFYAVPVCKWRPWASNKKEAWMALRSHQCRSWNSSVATPVLLIAPLCFVAVYVSRVHVCGLVTPLLGFLHEQSAGSYVEVSGQRTVTDCATTCSTYFSAAAGLVTQFEEKSGHCTCVDSNQVTCPNLPAYYNRRVFCSDFSMLGSSSCPAGTACVDDFPNPSFLQTSTVFLEATRQQVLRYMTSSIAAQDRNLTTTSAVGVEVTNATQWNNSVVSSRRPFLTNYQEQVCCACVRLPTTTSSSNSGGASRVPLLSAPLRLNPVLSPHRLRASLRVCACVRCSNAVVVAQTGLLSFDNIGTSALAVWMVVTEQGWGTLLQLTGVSWHSLSWIVYVVSSWVRLVAIHSMFACTANQDTTPQSYVVCVDTCCLCQVLLQVFFSVTVLCCCCLGHRFVIAIYVLALFAVNLVLGVFHAKLTIQHQLLAHNKMLEMQDEVRGVVHTYYLGCT